MTITTQPEHLKPLTNLREKLCISWADGSSDEVRSKYNRILDSMIPFLLAAAVRRRKKAGRTDQIKRVLIGLNHNLVQQEWDVQQKQRVDLRDDVCHDCGQPERNKKADGLGEVWDAQLKGWTMKPLYLRNQWEPHACIPRKEPVEGTTYTATYSARSAVPGLIGAHSIEWRDSFGKLIGGLMSSRLACEQQLRIWGFSGPINWTRK